MFGAILGDMIGAPYEFNNIHTEDFTLFTSRTEFTDDTVMTLAVADALMEAYGKDETEIKYQLVRKMQAYGKKWPHAGYGGMFAQWLREKYPEPYNSFGNGSAMRVSPAGWLYDTLEETLQKAQWTAEVTHNHPEGIKGAQAAAACIWMARNQYGKDEIMNYVTETFGYDLTETTDSIRKWYFFNETCQKTVPQAIRVFYESGSFEETIRKSVSLGGDSDTLACIAGSIAEAYYGVPDEMKQEALKRLDPRLITVLEKFEAFLSEKNGKKSG